MSEGRGTRWLDADQQASWRAFVVGITLLLDRLDADLQHAFDLSLTEYEILVRLSERPERQMRMAQLADALAHSRSRVTHTVTRMETRRARAAHLVARGRPRHRVPSHRRGVRRAGRGRARARAPACATTSSTWSAPRTSRALGRVMDAVSDRLIACHPEMDIRPSS